jgi:hypothetical protein
MELKKCVCKIKDGEYIPLYSMDWNYWDWCRWHNNKWVDYSFIDDYITYET